MVPYSGFLSLIAGKYVSISGKLSREKTIANLGKIRFLWRKRLWIAHFCCTKDCHISKFCEENFHE